MSDYFRRFADIHGVLCQAVAAEQQARAFYRRMAEAYGPRGPYPSLLAGSEKRVAGLTTICQRQSVACPADIFAGKEMLSGNWLDDCLSAANGEAKLIQFYQQRVAYMGHSEIAMLFEKLYRQSINTRLPKLLRAADSAEKTERFHAAYGIPREEAHQQHGFFSKFLENTFSILGVEHRALSLFAPALRSINPALLTGLAVGGAMAYVLKKQSPSKRKEG